jgi:hypothetical protein
VGDDGLDLRHAGTEPGGVAAAAGELGDDVEHLAVFRDRGAVVVERAVASHDVVEVVVEVAPRAAEQAPFEAGADHAQRGGREGAVLRLAVVAHAVARGREVVGDEGAGQRRAAGVGDARLGHVDGHRGGEGCLPLLLELEEPREEVAGADGLPAPGGDAEVVPLRRPVGQHDAEGDEELELAGLGGRGHDEGDLLPAELALGVVEAVVDGGQPSAEQAAPGVGGLVLGQVLARVEVDPVEPLVAVGTAEVAEAAVGLDRDDVGRGVSRQEGVAGDVGQEGGAGLERGVALPPQHLVAEQVGLALENGLLEAWRIRGPRLADLPGVADRPADERDGAGVVDEREEAPVAEVALEDGDGLAVAGQLGQGCPALRELLERDRSLAGFLGRVVGVVVHG